MTDCVTGGVHWAAASVSGAWLASGERTKGSVDLPPLDSKMWWHDDTGAGRCTGTVTSTWPLGAAAVMHKVLTGQVPGHPQCRAASGAERNAE